MEQQNYLVDELEQKKLSSTLNVLTILTFIGCGLGVLGAIYSFATAETNLRNLEKMMNDPTMSQMPSFVKNLVTEDTVKLARLNAANKVPILILTLLGLGFCLVGAIQMRKQKMMGYYYWLIGELLPFVCIGIFSSFIAFKGFGLFGILFPLVFIILYTSQRSNLTK